ncbi:MAG: hypothetical protein ACEQSC_01375 [Candidatus Nanopelagicaceae bacterium]|jgi:hypothetical protein
MSDKHLIYIAIFVTKSSVDETDFHSDILDFFVRGFEDCEAHQLLHGAKQNEKI